MNIMHNQIPGEPMPKLEAFLEYNPDNYGVMGLMTRVQVTEEIPFLRKLINEHIALGEDRDRLNENLQETQQRFFRLREVVRGTVAILTMQGDQSYPGDEPEIITEARNVRAVANLFHSLLSALKPTAEALGVTDKLQSLLDPEKTIDAETVSAIGSLFSEAVAHRD